jgi:uncharacterized membrane protein YkvA (DUF1232 family)
MATTGDMKTTSRFGERIARSPLFARLLRQAKGYVADPQKLGRLIDSASTKGTKVGDGPLQAIWGSVLALLRLLRAYWRGEYRQVPTQSLLLIVAGILYFVSPLDLIPDVIVGLGFVDDVAVLGWVLSQVRTVVDDYLRWESAQSGNRTAR